VAVEGTDVDHFPRANPKTAAAYRKTSQNSIAFNLSMLSCSLTSEYNPIDDGYFHVLVLDGQRIFQPRSPWRLAACLAECLPQRRKVIDGVSLSSMNTKALTGEKAIIWKLR